MYKSLMMIGNWLRNDDVRNNAPGKVLRHCISMSSLESGLHLAIDIFCAKAGVIEVPNAVAVLKELGTYPRCHTGIQCRFKV